MTAIAGSFNLIQQESVQFNNPVSESTGTTIGASVNALIGVLLAPGSIIHSMLTEAQFQTELGTTNWVLADGRSVTGSRYEAITGNGNIPDLRGIFLRGKNNGRSDGNQNPAGNEPLGTIEASQNISHNHLIADPGHTHSASGFDSGNTTVGAGGNRFVVNPINAGVPRASNVAAAFTGITGTGTSGGADARPTNVTVNIFIRIN